MSELGLFRIDREAPRSGVCEVCGCTDTEACIGTDGNPCHWVDMEHTLCSSCSEEDDDGAEVEA